MKILCTLFLSFGFTACGISAAHGAAPAPVKNSQPLQQVRLHFVSDGKLELKKILMIVHTSNNSRECLTEHRDELGNPVYRPSEFDEEFWTAPPVGPTYTLRYFRDRYVPGECGWRMLVSPQVLVTYFDEENQRTYTGRVFLNADPNLPPEQHAGEIVCERFVSNENVGLLQCEPPNYDGKGIRFNPDYEVNIRLK